jgi:hypothetical protein
MRGRKEGNLEKDKCLVERNPDKRIAWLKGSGKAKSYTERGTMRLGRKEGHRKSDCENNKIHEEFM